MNPELKFSPEELEILKTVWRLARPAKAELFLVGGLLRDILLGRPQPRLDFDFCLKKGAINFGRSLARSMKAGFVVLDKQRGACRVVKKADFGIVTLDLTDFRARTLEQDLKSRDFRINTLALGLDKAILNKDLEDFLFDPCSGRPDLERGLIRATGRKVFEDDPLRILRAFSFSAVLGFSIDKETLRFAARQRAGLGFCSGERVRDELFKILDTPSAAACFIAMYKAGVLEAIFPEIKKMRGIGRGVYHHLDVLGHTLEAVRQLEALIAALRRRPRIQEYLDQEVSAGRSRRALLKFGTFLHDIGKPAAMRRVGPKVVFWGHERIGLAIAEDIADRLKLSNEETHSLRKMVLWHLRPGYLTNVDKITPRAMYKYFRDTGNEALGILLLSIADQQATCGPKITRAFKDHYELTVFGLIDEYFRRQQEQKKMPRLLGGDDLIKKFKLAPSPLIGKILAEIEELQAIGTIKTKKQAFERARKMINM